MLPLGKLAVVALAALLCACDSSKAAGRAAASATAETSAGASAAPALVKLDGVDTSALTAREHQAWSVLVSSELSPCKDVAVSVAQCIADKRACKACLPAAQFLLRQVQAGQTRENIVKSYEARFSPDRVKSIVIGDSASRGPSDAPVTIVEFADFECPGCRDAYPILDDLLAHYEGKLRLVFKCFPWPMHPNAMIAAEAGYAAQKQGQFWRMHHLMFDNQDRLTEPDLMSYAEKIGLDMAKFKADFRSDAARAHVEEEHKQGEELGVSYTPALFIDGRECDLGALGNPVQELDRWVRDELQEKGVDLAPAASASAAPSAKPSAAQSASARPAGGR